MKIPEQIKNRIENIRDGLDRADRAHDAEQIGHILITLSQLTDLVEMLFESTTTAKQQTDPYAAARDEHQAERRIDEWAAYHDQERD